MGNDLTDYKERRPGERSSYETPAGTIVVTKTYSKNHGNLSSIQHTLDGNLHNETGPAHIGYRKDGSIMNVFYYEFGKFHNVRGPAYIHYDLGKTYKTRYAIRDCDVTNDEFMILSNYEYGTPEWEFTWEMMSIS